MQKREYENEKVQVTIVSESFTHNLHALESKEKSQIKIPNRYKIFEVKIDFLILDQKDSTFHSFQDVLDDILADWSENKKMAFVIEVSANCLLEKFLICQEWNLIHFDSSQKKKPKTWAISPFFDPLNKENFPLKFIINSALNRIFQYDSNVKVQRFERQSLAYCDFLVQIGFKPWCKLKTLDSFLDSFHKKSDNSFVLLHLSTFIVPYEIIVTLHWRQEDIYLLFGIHPSISKIRKKQFVSQVQAKEIEKDDKNKKETIDLLTIVCDPKKLNLAVYLCAMTLKKVGPTLPTYYFYPFQDSPNDTLLKSIDPPLLTSYTIYRTLLDSGYVRKISKYNKYGVLRFSYDEKKREEVKSIPYHWFPFHIERMDKILGEGSFGCTLLVQLKDEKNLSVVKIVVMEGDLLKSHILNEIDIHDLLDTIHLPQIPRFIGAQEYKSLQHFEKELISLKKVEETCPIIAEKLKKTKSPIYSIAMSAATGGSIVTLYKSRPLNAQMIQSILFQMIFTLHSLEQSFGFIHRDLNVENIMFIDIEEKKRGLWKFEFPSIATWWVPMDILVQSLILV